MNAQHVIQFSMPERFTDFLFRLSASIDCYPNIVEVGTSPNQPEDNGPIAFHFVILCSLSDIKWNGVPYIDAILGWREKQQATAKTDQFAGTKRREIPWTCSRNMSSELIVHGTARLYSQLASGALHFNTLLWWIFFIRRKFAFWTIVRRLRNYGLNRFVTFCSCMGTRITNRHAANVIYWRPPMCRCQPVLYRRAVLFGWK